VQDITDRLNKYRECARGIWNNFLRSDIDAETHDSFSAICEHLMQELVLKTIGRPEHRRAGPDEPYPFLHIVPVAPTVPIMINRPSHDRNKYWDDPVRDVSQRGSDLLFIDYFDWDNIGFIDFQYYRVAIAGFDGQPHLAGRQALLDVHNAQVFFQEE
jgi:hypothetical protein